MLDRRYILAATMSAFAAGPGFAADKRPFDKAAFQAAQARGAPILVEVTAPWCPTCRAQAPIIGAVAAKPEFARLVIFSVDFDSRKDVLREFNVRQQSTLILFKGRTETGRSTGETNASAIESLMRGAI